jgi:hypothetical protein
MNVAVAVVGEGDARVHDEGHQAVRPDCLGEPAVDVLEGLRP